jgi:hypothetical protein
VFETPEQAVTPGQWSVFYDREGFVLGAAIVQGFKLALPAECAGLRGAASA